METTCRICSNREDDNIHIFGNEGHRTNIQFKIRKYLYLTISSDDKLPQVICCHCCKKLDAIHRFATMAFTIQTRFKELLDLNEKPVNTTNKCNGLLHSYLLKGKVNCKQSTENNDVTEMEVRVDPTIFLQCLLEENNDDNDNELTEDDSQSSTDDSLSNSPKTITFSRSRQELIDFMTTSMNYSKIPSDTEITLMTTNERANVQTMILSSDGRAPETNPSDEIEISVDTRYCRDVDVVDKTTTSFACESELQKYSWSRATSDDSRTSSSTRRRNDTLFSKHNEDFASNVGSSYDSCDNDTKRKDVLIDSLPDYTCPVCGKYISTKGNLKVHLETHRPKGKYECNICSRIFKTESNLEKHKDYHGGIQFPCGVCGRVYPTNSTLRAHSITHSDLRPHKCSMCKKTFKRNQDLKFHINQHTGARPYQCLYCPKAFASSGNCFSHRKRMHAQEVERDREQVTYIT